VNNPVEPVKARVPAGRKDLSKIGVRLKTLKVAISEICPNPSHQFRSELDQPTVQQYAGFIQSGVILPDPIVWLKGGDYLELAGCHTIQAHLVAKRKKIKVKVFEGTEDDALIISLKSNARHGRPLNNKEKEKAVERALVVLPDLSDRELAKLCGVTPPHVKAVSERSGISRPERSVGQDGKSYPREKKQVKTVYTSSIENGPAEPPVKDLTEEAPAEQPGTPSQGPDECAKLVPLDPDPAPTACPEEAIGPIPRETPCVTLVEPAATMAEPVPAHDPCLVAIAPTVTEFDLPGGLLIKIPGWKDGPYPEVTIKDHFTPQIQEYSSSAAERKAHLVLGALQFLAIAYSMNILGLSLQKAAQCSIKLSQLWMSEADKDGGASV